MSKTIEKISIIIPAYNQEKYIERCIQSAINQTQPALEIIVVNDGSTDNTLKIIEGYKDKIRIISQKNGGVSSARNKAIENAIGDWILLLDSDDELFLFSICGGVKFEDADDSVLDPVVVRKWTISFSTPNPADPARWCLKCVQRSPQ